MTKTLLSALSAITLVSTLPGHADDQFFDTVIVRDPLLCIGADCVDGELDIPGRQGLKIKEIDPAILFQDTFQNESSPDRDWMLGAGEFNASPRDVFFLRDVDAGTDPVRIRGGAGDNALYLDNNGNIGFGTALPEANLHIVGAAGTGIRLEGDNNISPTNSVFEASVGNFGFLLADRAAVTFPFGVSNGAPSNAMIIDAEGDVGLGTFTPTAPLELSSAQGFNFFRITATGAAVNESVDITFTGGPLGTGQLRYNIVDGDNQEMSLDADGNMVLDGTLTTAGPTCAGGCDRVFDADYALPSLTDHQQAMYTAGYLPAMGPTMPGAQVNVTEKMGKMLNELEHAHIYIGQMHARLETQETEKAALQATVARQEARLVALEALILQ